MLLPLPERNLCYDIVGPESGDVVVFSHSLGADLGMWAEQLPALLGAGYRVLRMDLPGHGGSDALSPPYTIDLLAEDVITMLDALEIKQCHFVGLSIGGMIGQSLGIRHGSRFRSLMLCDTQTQTPDNFTPRVDARIEAITRAGTCEVLADETLDRWLTADYKGAHARRWKQIRNTVAGCSVKGYMGCAQAICNFNFTARLKAVKVPTLFACGTEDPGASPAATRHAATLVQAGSYAEFPNAKHLPNIENPDLFNQVLLGWIGSQR